MATTTTISSVQKRRRKHKNSKFGCPNCKSRRIKCTEELPQCSNCVKYKQLCLYLTWDEEQLEKFRIYKGLASEKNNNNTFITNDDSITKINNTNNNNINNKNNNNTSNSNDINNTPINSNDNSNSMVDTNVNTNVNGSSKSMSPNVTKNLAGGPNSSKSSSHSKSSPITSANFITGRGSGSSASSTTITPTNIPSLTHSPGVVAQENPGTSYPPHVPSHGINVAPNFSQISSISSILDLAPGQDDRARFNKDLLGNIIDDKIDSIISDSGSISRFPSNSLNVDKIDSRSGSFTTNNNNTNNNNQSNHNNNSINNNNNNNNINRNNINSNKNHNINNDIGSNASNMVNKSENTISSNTENNNSDIQKTSNNYDVNDITIGHFSDISSNASLFQPSHNSFNHTVATSSLITDSDNNVSKFSSNVDYHVRNQNDRQSLFNDHQLNLEHDIPYFSRNNCVNVSNLNKMNQDLYANFVQNLQNDNIQLKLSDSFPKFRNQFQIISSNDSKISKFRFAKIKHIKTNFIEQFENKMFDYDKLIQANSQTLFNTKDLQSSWLGQYFYWATHSKVYFNCLMTLTINYLASVKCTTNPNYRFDNESINHQISNSIDKINQNKKLKASLEIKGINYFNPIIRHLSTILGSDPLVSAQISSFLLLLSIYDQNVNLVNVNCFRNGLFSILEHNYNQYNQTADVLKSKFIPVQLNLVKEFLRSIYLPSYNFEIVKEFKQISNHFFTIIKSQLDPVEILDLKIMDLLDFVDVCINVHYPIISNNLNNMSIQQEELLKMLIKWAQILPSDYTNFKPSFNPLQLLSFLFFNSFKKIMNALFPQIKFFFLTDFELFNFHLFNLKSQMSYIDNWTTSIANSNFNSNYKFEIYTQEFQFYSNYLIRMSTFFDSRVTLLNRLLITNSNKFPIHSINDWVYSICMIGDKRDQFTNTVGYEEVEVTSFTDTIIRSYHYPKGIGITNVAIADFDSDLSPGSPTTVDQTKFQKLTSAGLLEQDFVPKNVLI